MLNFEGKTIWVKVVRMLLLQYNISISTTYTNICAEIQSRTWEKEKNRKSTRVELN